MKLLSLPMSFATTVALAACTPKGRPPIPSDDGSLTLHTSVESSHSDETAYGCVIIEVQDKAAKILHRENSHASAFHRWDIAWTSNDQFQLVSSDVGTATWTRQPDATWKKDGQSNEQSTGIA